jgi:hypothetical protein
MGLKSTNANWHVKIYLNITVRGPINRVAVHYVALE